MRFDWRILSSFGLFGLACSSTRGAPFEQTESAPQAVVSAPFDIGDATQFAGVETGSPSVGCNRDGQCLVAYTQETFDGVFIFARRMSAAGEIEPKVISVGKALSLGTQIVVGARDSGEYVVSWITDKFYFVRVSTAGTLIDTTPRVINTTTSGIVQILGNADRYVFLHTDYVDGGSVLRAMRVENGQAIDAPGPILGTGASSHAVLAGNQLGVAIGPNSFIRLDLGSGTVLDSTPVAYAKYAEGGPAAVAFDGTNYVLIWPFGSKSYAARVRASDGVLLDPPDDFNGVTGGHVVGGYGVLPRAFFDGTNVLAFWRSGSGLVGARVTSAATRADGRPDLDFEFRLADALGDAYTFDADFRAGFGVVVSADVDSFTAKRGVESLRIQGSAGAVPTVSAPTAVSYYGPNHDVSASVSNGRDFLAVYRDYRLGHVYAKVVDGATGAAGPAIPIGIFAGGVLEGGERIGIAWSGKNYVVVWRDDNYVYMSVLACDGTVVKSNVRVATGHYPNVACNDTTCAIVWRNIVGSNSVVSAVRVRPADGSLVDATPVPLGSADVFIGTPAVTADLTPAPALRTFLVGWPTTTGWVSARFRSDTGAVPPLVTVDPASAQTVALATDGTRFFAVWQASDKAWASAVDPFSGAATGPKLELGPLPTSSNGVAPTVLATFDGRSFVAAWSTGNLQTTRVDTASNRLDPVPVDSSVIGYQAPGEHRRRAVRKVSRDVSPLRSRRLRPHDQGTISRQRPRHRPQRSSRRLSHESGGRRHRGR
jgi:hypothetical protein